MNFPESKNGTHAPLEHDEFLCSPSNPSTCCPECLNRFHSIPRADCNTETQEHTALKDLNVFPVSPCASVSPVLHPEVVRKIPEFVIAVFEVAKKKPSSDTATRYYLPNMRMLVMLCAELQIAAGIKTFFLTCRDAGDLIGEGHVRISRWLKRLEVDGVLERIATGERGDKVFRKANEYRFHG